MDSFASILEGIRAALEGDTALKAFCVLKWSKAHMVKILYKKRNEIGLEEFPLIFLTRPHKSADKVDALHTVYIYYGFNQSNREIAANEALLYEEAIDAALSAFELGNKYALYIQPVQTSNDEGTYHPIYFGVKAVEIQQTIS